MAIDTAGIFVEAFSKRLPEGNRSFEDILSELETLARKQDPAVTGGATNNARENWFEWLLAISAWNARGESNKSGVIATLPNVAGFDCSSLYVRELFEMIQHLRSELLLHEVGLVTSNPDFVILDQGDAFMPPLSKTITRVPSVDIVHQLDSLYENFIGRCSFEQIAGYLSVKSSLRPDRRLQVAHEGSLMKALYAHLQTRLWVTKPRGLKYYAMAPQATNADYQALRTIATHSIPDVNSEPQRAVDHLFVVGTLDEALSSFIEMLPS
jgi:hypothetical protein